MTLLALLAIAGLLLIVIEIVFIPGTTIVGIFGGLLSAYSVIKAYTSYGMETGHVFLFSTILGGIAILFFCFRANVWQRFANNSISEGKATNDLDQELTLGEEGVTLSDLRPIGKEKYTKYKLQVFSAVILQSLSLLKFPLIK